MIFISAPYSHPNKEVVEKRMEIVSKYCAKLLVDDIHPLTPLTHGTCILKYAKLPSDFTFWKNISFEMLKCCTEMYVLTIDGWDKSEGVLAEIDFATKNNIKITYIDLGILEKL